MLFPFALTRSYTIKQLPSYLAAFATAGKGKRWILLPHERASAREASDRGMHHFSTPADSPPVIVRACCS